MFDYTKFELYWCYWFLQLPALQFNLLYPSQDAVDFEYKSEIQQSPNPTSDGNFGESGEVEKRNTRIIDQLE